MSIELRLRFGPAVSLGFAIIPLLLIGAYWFGSDNINSFFFLFILNYLIQGINRYVPLKIGIVMLIINLSIFILLILKNHFKPLEWKRARTLPIILWSVWLVYCILEVFNPMAMFAPWSIAITSYALFPLLTTLFVAVIMKKYRNIQWLMIAWGALTFLAAVKGYWQRNRGFDYAELHWLLVEGGARTHFIHSGVRYFSFFSDAANFGSAMGQSLVVFGIAGFYQRNLWIKVCCFGVAFCGAYGLLISGTRSAIAVPVAGVLAFVIMSRNIKAIVTSLLILGFAVFILKYTDVGADNSLIRRMRTVFHSEHDASFQVRVDNQAKLAGIMKDLPIGTGLGLGGGKAKRFKPNATLTKIATDSWMVMIWVETGIIGIVLYYSILLIIFIRGAYITSFQIKDNEVKGLMLALLAGVAGMLVSSYGNEILSFPNGMVVFFSMAAPYVAKYYDEEQALNKDKKSLWEILFQ